MLRHLRVTNFAILSDVSVELGGGMNVLTGETGAGKSLIVEAVNLLRGGRASADIPRAGADEAVVEAIVDVPLDLCARVSSVLEGAGLPRSVSASDDENEVFIRRVIQRGGRSRTYVNGALTTAARLAELGALLIDLSGQHQHQGLVDPSRHLDLIDAFAAQPASMVLGGASQNGGSQSKGSQSKASSAAVPRRTDLHEAATAGSQGGSHGGGSHANPLAAAMTAAWVELRACDEELVSLGGDEREREARVDYLCFQLEELDAAALLPGEDATIELERSRLASVDQLQGAARRAETLLYGDDDSARDRVAAAAREIDRVLRVDPSLESVSKQCAEIEALIDDAADQLRNYAEKLEGDPERLAYLDERIALIRRLVRKHGTTAAPSPRSASSTAPSPRSASPTAPSPRSASPSPTSSRATPSSSATSSSATSSAAPATNPSSATSSGATSSSATPATNPSSATSSGATSSTSFRLASSSATPAATNPSAISPASSGPMSGLDIVLAKAVELRLELDALTSRDEKLAALADRRAKAEVAAVAAAAALTKSRTKAARKLEKEVAASLAELGMGSAKLTVVIESRPLGPTGSDRVELMLASNTGEDTRPLAKIASGGELSRIMLALKLALRRADEVATYVFDEVDTGIGGATAQVVGAQIRAIASTDVGRQVLCVTHLPQIAAFADHHFHVEKTEIAGRTETHVRKLNAAARKDELARMLGGHATSKARAHAAELLAEAARPRSTSSSASSKSLARA